MRSSKLRVLPASAAGMAGRTASTRHVQLQRGQNAPRSTLHCSSGAAGGDAPAVDGFGALTVNLVKADGGAPVDFLVVAVSGLARRSGPGTSSLPRRWGLLAVLAGRFGNQGAAQLSRGWPQGAVATVPRPRTKQPDSAGSSSEIPVAPSALCPVGVPLSLARVEHPSLGPPFGMALARSRRPFPVPHPAARAGTHPNNARAGGRRRPAPDRKPPCNQVTLNRVATRGVHPSSGDMAEKPGRSCRSLVL
ncbi:hypothetical protein CGC20_1040 [Leishmania donovani]|uniref:Uncharacterized protein n=1 Tax=Leishmania donovani TaxID=5661 RepID=A0A504X888_LEIDO|nr:hypothetical protein CGC20_1040 [Leishmania donovani]